MLIEARVDELNRAGVLKAARVEALTAGAIDRVIAEFSAGSDQLVMLGYVLKTVYMIVSQLAPTWSQLTVPRGLHMCGTPCSLACRAELGARPLEALPALRARVRGGSRA